MRFGPWSVTWVMLCGCLALAYSGCGARTNVSSEGRRGIPESDGGGSDGGLDASTIDGGGSDGGLDASAIDGGGSDGGLDASASDGGGGMSDGSVAPACTRDADCSGGRVCRLERGSSMEDLIPAPLGCGLSWRGGRRPGAICAREQDCARGLCLVSDRCAMPCATDGDCPRGQWCLAGARVRRGRDALQLASVCVDDANLPPSVGFERRSVGSISPASMPGRSIELPGKEGSVLHALWNVGRRSTRGYALLWRLEERPDGVTLFDLDAYLDPALRYTPLNGVSFGADDFDVLPILLPNGPAIASSTMGYRAWLEVEFSAPVERTTAWRVDQGDTFDLDIFYVGGGGWHPVGLRRGPPQVTAWVERLQDIFASVGLGVGSVFHHDVPGGTRLEYEFLDTMDGELDMRRFVEMNRLSAGLGRPSVPVFLVRSLGIALGVSANVPGLQGMYGRGASGLAIAVDLLRDLESDGGGTLAHEIGHFLGLFHTSEQDGTVLEALEDTPECRADRDANGDGFVDDVECAGAGADNLMFWLAGDEPQVDLSSEQGRIVRSSMIAY